MMAIVQIKSESAAVFSNCRTYRYFLQRYVRDPLFRNKPLKTIAWVMLNPSVADENANDPTIRRCIGFSKDWGYDRLVVGNLYPLRATDPAELHRADEKRKVGKPGLNDDWLNRMSVDSDAVVFAWGNNGSKCKERVNDVVKMLMKRKTQCYVLGYTANGQPLHPLMQPADLNLKLYVRVQ